MVRTRLCVAALLCSFITVGENSNFFLGENIAKGKEAGQVSTAWGGDAGRAVDGIMKSHYLDNSCTHTGGAIHPYWWVDLGKEYYVRRVVIQNRSDCCFDRLRKVYISVGNDKEASMPVCAHFEEALGPGEVKEFYCTRKIKGRFVKVQTMIDSYLTLCEVQVFGFPAV